jgi:uncharacterized protein (TIGR00369 family)
MADDVTAQFNAHRGGFNTLIGLEFTEVTPDRVVARVPVSPQLTQPYGIVHGGVYATIVETLASSGAAISAMARNQTTVGLENSTSFLRAVRGGTLVGTATPLHRGRSTQVWEVTITDDAGKVAATGRVRMICLEAGAAIAGETVTVKS